MEKGSKYPLLASIPRSYANLIAYLVGLGVIANAFDAVIPGARYATYSVPPLVVLAWLAYRTQFEIPLQSRYLVSAGLLLSSVLASSMVGGTPLPIVTFLILPMFAGAFIVRVERQQMIVILVAIGLGQIAHLQKNGFGGTIFDLIHSQGLSESQMSFPLALTTVALFAAGQKRAGIASLLQMVVAFKRVTLVSVAVAWLGSVVRISPRLIRILDRSPSARYAAAATIFAACAWVSFQLNDIAEAIRLQFPDLFRSAEDLLLGRFSFSNTLESYFDTHATWLNFALGFGPQSMTQTIGAIYYPGIDRFLLHNDYMFVNFEFGFAGQLLFLAAFLIAFASSRQALLLCLTQAVLLMTDNTLIYSFHILVLIACENYLWWCARAVDPEARNATVAPLVK